MLLCPIVFSRLSLGHTHNPCLAFSPYWTRYAYKIHNFSNVSRILTLAHAIFILHLYILCSPIFDEGASLSNWTNLPNAHLNAFLAFKIYSFSNFSFSQLPTIPEYTPVSAAPWCSNSLYGVGAIHSPKCGLRRPLILYSRYCALSYPLPYLVWFHPKKMRIT